VIKKIETNQKRIDFIERERRLTSTKIRKYVLLFYYTTAVKGLTVENECMVFVTHNESVVVSGLEEVDAVLTDKVDDTVFLGKPARPHARSDIFERFRFTNPLKGVAQDGFYQIKGSQG